MKLVDDWRKSWRWLSVQLAAVATILPQAWAMMPDDLKAWIPEEWRLHILSVICLAIIAGRLIDQGGKDA